MSPIDDEEKATRLARAIVADIRLYNEAAITAGKDITPQVAEGRELFRSRVVPALHRIFETAIADGTIVHRTVPAPPVRSGLGEVAPEGAPRGLLVAGIAIAALALAAALFLLRS